MKGWLIGVGSIAAVNAFVAVNAFAAIVLMWTLWNMQHEEHEEAPASAEPGAHSQGNGNAIMWALLTARPRVPGEATMPPAMRRHGQPAVRLFVPVVAMAAADALQGVTLLF